jgi:thymidylate synthase (FAD)
MNITLIDYTADPVNKIGQAAAICYEARTDRESNIKRAAHCKDKGHLATMRFAYATVAIEGISRVCSHQLVRIAHAGILQESQRYVEQSNVEFVTPDSLSCLDDFDYSWLKKDWSKVLSDAIYVYEQAIKAGMKKEDARYILPQSCTTKVNLCMNFQAWQDFLKNRTGKTAQWEVRELALEIEKLLHGIAPEIF